MSVIDISQEELKKIKTEKEYFIEKEIPAGGFLYKMLKRLFDILFSLIIIGIVFLPAVLLSIVICIESRGGPFYVQERLGKNGKKFKMIKFRTMRQDSEDSGAQWAQEDDPRCTKLGKVLRKFRIDEIPQALNILAGHMSFIGPRPERKVFYDFFETYIHGFENRLSVTPGLTGLAQVNGGYILTPEEKIVFDMEYIKNRSVWLDIKILFKTIKLIFTHEGAR